MNDGQCQSCPNRKEDKNPWPAAMVLVAIIVCFTAYRIALLYT